MKTLTLKATLENLNTVIGTIEEELETAGCPMSEQMQITVASEEIFVNIANYAYTPAEGEATVTIDITGDKPKRCEIVFSDTGVPFDPLAKADPDVTLSAEDRPIGGLGIYMVKNSMDEVKYEYKDSHNILTLIKNF